MSPSADRARVKVFQCAGGEGEEDARGTGALDEAAATLQN